jgi:hypothetical protein
MSAYAGGCIAAYGAELTVKSAQTPQGRAGRGFVSPITPRDTARLRVASKTGFIDREEYLLIADADVIAEGETERTVSCLGTEYELIRAERVTVGADVSHWEGVMRLKSGVAGDA